MGGADNVQLVQPFQVHTSYGTIAVAHNGELVNSNRLRERILANGVGLSTGRCIGLRESEINYWLHAGSDSELITQALSMEPPEQFKQDFMNRKFNNSLLKRQRSLLHNGYDQDLEDLNSSFNHSSPYATHLSEKEADFVARILHVRLSPNVHLIKLCTSQLMSLAPLSYSLVILYDECIYAIRDPFGNRPLCLGALGLFLSIIRWSLAHNFYLFIPQCHWTRRWVI